MTDAMLIRREVVPMFRDPDPLTEQVSQAVLGTRVRLVLREGEWSRIETPDGYQGWVENAALHEPTAEWRGAGRWAEVEPLWANLRGGADFRLAAVALGTIGVRLPVLSSDDRWTQLLLPDDRRVWTETRRLHFLEGDPYSLTSHRPREAAAIVRTARRFLNVPYLWGGCSPLGLDCSGYVQLVYRLHGVPIRRDAGQQAEDGTPVEKGVAGDLVYFGPPSRPEAITHVGLLVDEDRFLHARGGRHVTINRITDQEYGPRYRFARRYL